MYEHFTFIYLLLFQRHRLDPKIGGKKNKEGAIEESDRNKRKKKKKMRWKKKPKMT